MDSEWALVSHQVVVMNHLMEDLPKVTGYNNCSLMYRPFFIFWFVGQISRVLTSWSMDNSLLVALDVGKAITTPTEYLMSLFPCDGTFYGFFSFSRLTMNFLAQRVVYQSLHEQLVAACISARIPPPPPPKISVRTVSALVGAPEHLEGYHSLPHTQG